MARLIIYTIAAGCMGFFCSTGGIQSSTWQFWAILTSAIVMSTTIGTNRFYLWFDVKDLCKMAYKFGYEKGKKDAKRRPDHGT